MTRNRTRYTQAQSTSLDGLPDRLSDWWWSFADRALEYLEDFGALALGVATVLTVWGVIGWGMAILLTDTLGGLGGVLLLVGVALAAGVFGLGPTLAHLIPDDRRAIVTDDPYIPVPSAAEESAVTVVARPTAGAPALVPGARHVPRAFRKNFRVEPVAVEKKASSGSRSERLPPLEVLERGELVQITAREINLAAGLIEN